MICLKGKCQSVNQGRGDQGLIALNINDGIKLWQSMCHLSNSICAAGMIWRGQHGLCTKGMSCIHDACVVGGDDDFIHGLTLLTPFPYVLNQRLPSDEVKHLSGKPGGTPSGRDGDKSA